MTGTPKVIYGEKRRFSLSGQGKSGIFLRGDYVPLLFSRQALEFGRFFYADYMIIIFLSISTLTHVATLVVSSALSLPKA